MSEEVWSGHSTKAGGSVCTFIPDGRGEKPMPKVQPVILKTWRHPEVAWRTPLTCSNHARAVWVEPLFEKHFTITMNRDSSTTDWFWRNRLAWQIFSPRHKHFINLITTVSEVLHPPYLSFKLAMKSSIDTLSKSTKSAFPYSRLSCSAMITSTETLRREDGSKSYSKCCQKHWRVSHLPQSSPLENGILLFQSQIRRHVHSWFIKFDFIYIYIYWFPFEVLLLF